MTCKKAAEYIKHFVTRLMSRGAVTCRRDNDAACSCSDSGQALVRRVDANQGGHTDGTAKLTAWPAAKRTAAM